MRGAVFLGNRKIEIRKFPDPAPGPGEVVIRMRASGMCGSDLHVYRAPGVNDHDAIDVTLECDGRAAFLLRIVPVPLTATVARPGATPAVAVTPAPAARQAAHVRPQGAAAPSAAAGRPSPPGCARRPRDRR